MTSSHGPYKQGGVVRPPTPPQDEIWVTTCGIGDDGEVDWHVEGIEPPEWFLGAAIIGFSFVAVLLIMLGFSMAVPVSAVVPRQVSVPSPTPNPPPALRE